MFARVLVILAVGLAFKAGLMIGASNEAFRAGSDGHVGTGFAGMGLLAISVMAALLLMEIDDRRRG